MSRWSEGLDGRAEEPEEGPVAFRLFTVGHSSHSLGTFLELLRVHKIDIVVDVRSQPHSRYSPHFNRPSLERAIVGLNAHYIFLGLELGGRPPEKRFYDPDGRVRYDWVAETPRFARGIETVRTLAKQKRLAVLCSEENPRECHRRLLVGRVLAERGAELMHIRDGGIVEPEREFLPFTAIGVQNSLFSEGGTGTWKSSRSVLPGRVPKNFSGF